MATEITLKSGAKVMVGIAPWKDAKAWKQAIQLEAGTAGINFGADVIDTMLKVDGSPLVDAAMWPVLARSTYKGAKIIEDTFNDVAARADYYEIIFAVAKANLGPLLESLYSALPDGMKAMLPKIAKSPESASTTPTSSSPAA